MVGGDKKCWKRGWRSNIGLKLNEMEGDWMIFTIDTIELDRCRNKKYQFRVVTKSYNETIWTRGMMRTMESMHIMHSVRKHIYALLNNTRTIRMKAVSEFSCRMMTVTVRIQAMYGNMWEQVKQGGRQRQRKRRKLKRRLQQERRRGGMGDSGDRVIGGEDAMMGAMMGPLHWNMVSLLASLAGRWKYYNTMTVHGSRQT